MPSHAELLGEFEQFGKSAATVESLMARMCQRLHDEKARYNWVGFYLLDPSGPGFLMVGPYVGSFAPNERIPLDRGLCGACATSGQTIVLQDVTKDPRYLAGSDMVKSEIVIPIFVRGKLAAEFDVESYFANTFVPADQDFCEACASLVGRYMERTRR
ncbi:MAG TPA: GAF domain-containing protein [Alphaproteobacteria bacterium]|nr:GAF domain-containing protein [Alphaproteobacteria bacterium]